MFEDCESLASLHGLEKWDVSNVTDLTQMFSGCSSIDSVDILEKWDTSNVKEMTSVFNNTNITTGPSNFKYSISA
jgi:surface protein